MPPLQLDPVALITAIATAIVGLGGMAALLIDKRSTARAAAIAAAQAAQRLDGEEQRANRNQENEEVAALLDNLRKEREFVISQRDLVVAERNQLNAKLQECIERDERRALEFIAMREAHVNEMSNLRREHSIEIAIVRDEHMREISALNAKLEGLQLAIHGSGTPVGGMPIIGPQNQTGE